MIQKNLKPITETKYLSVDNAWRYRGIMRAFYISDQQYRHWMHKEEVYETLSSQETFRDYTLDQCKQDLDALVEWGNLSAVQDTSKVATYQQFINRQFRYQMTEYAIEIERMTIRLENIFVEGGSLEASLLERILDQVKQLRHMSHGDPQVIGAWWSNLSADFQRLNQNYQDYIREWYSIKAEELMKSRSFLTHKERLVEYLRHFIKELQKHAFEVESLLKKVTLEEKLALIDGVSFYERNIPRLDLEAVTDGEIHDLVEGKVQSFFHFFVGALGQESEVDRILSMTNEIIRRITRSAVNLLEASGQFSSRREEYRQIAGMFHRYANLEEAHRLSAAVFGIAGYKHFKSDQHRQTESIQSTMVEEPPLVVITAPRIREYRERLEKSAIVDRSEEKAAMRMAILKEKEGEEQALRGLISSGTLELKTLEGAEPFVRRAILRWLAKAVPDQAHGGRTEFGVKYTILNPDTQERCVMAFPDGLFELPAYELRFEIENRTLVGRGELIK